MRIMQHATSDIKLVNDVLIDARPSNRTFSPGSLVYHDLYGSNRTFGIVVATDDECTTVLWSKPPGFKVRSDSFNSLTDMSWVTNPVDPKTKVKHIIDCATEGELQLKMLASRQ